MDIQDIKVLSNYIERNTKSLINNVLNKKFHVVTLTHEILKEVTGVKKAEDRNNIILMAKQWALSNTKNPYKTGLNYIVLDSTSQINTLILFIKQKYPNVDTIQTSGNITTHKDIIKSLGLLDKRIKVAIKNASPLLRATLVKSITNEVNELLKVELVAPDISIDKKDISASLNKALTEWSNSINIFDSKDKNSVYNVVSNNLTDIFNGIKVPSKKIKKTIVVKPKDVKVKKSTGSALPPIGVSDSTNNLLSLKAIINKMLHDTLKSDVMGKDSDMPSAPLRYQTGRFARSARVTNITQNQSDFLNIFYTYQKYPYEVFEPGHKMYRYNRNPKLLIPKAIRIIATELLGDKIKIRSNVS